MAPRRVQAKSLLNKPLNPDALTRLVGPKNQTRCLLNDREYVCLLDSGAQANAITENVLEDLGLDLIEETPFEVVGTGNNRVAYLGYTEINLKFPSVKAFNRSEPFLVLPRDDTAQALHVQIGTNPIDLAIDLMTESEMGIHEAAWNRCRFSAMAAAIYKGQQLDSKSLNSPLDRSYSIKTRQGLTIPPKSTIVVNARTDAKWVGQTINVSVEERLVSKGVKLHQSYGEITGGTGNIDVVLTNENDYPFKIKLKTYLGKCQPANLIPTPEFSEKADHLQIKFTTADGQVEGETLFEDIPTTSQLSNVLVQMAKLQKVEYESSQTIQKPVLHQKATEVKRSIPPPDILPDGPDLEEEALDSRELPPDPSQMNEEERQAYLLSKLDLSGLDDQPLAIQQAAKNLMLKYKDLFALTSTELGNSRTVKHKIQLTDPIPFKERYRTIAPARFEEVRKMLKDMLDVGAIKPSNSPWSSAVVLAKKKDGSTRFCIDLRKLNDRTIKDAYALPRIEDSLHSLGGMSWFTSLDLQSGYWQVELDEASKEMTAFTVGPLGFYQCERMPFGLTNAPATFQRLMESCLGDLHLVYCLIYLDDIIIYSETIEDQLVRLEAVFEKLRAEGLKLKPSKCDFFKRKLKYLGHVVSKEGVEPDPDKIKAVREWPTPKTVTAVRSFLGFCNHYRRFIKDFAKVARPLHELTSGDLSKRKRYKINLPLKALASFQVLKNKITSAPCLIYPDFNKPFLLYTDACGYGLGAALYQPDPDTAKKRPVAFASRSVNAAEKRYPAHKLEFLALKWAVTDQFAMYLTDREFNAYTDSNPLTYVLTTAKLDATQQRWVAQLANFRFALHYKKGSTNTDADALSRIDWEDMPTSLVETTLKEACDVKALALSLPGQLWTKAAQLIQDDPDPLTHDWALEQRKDPLLNQVIGLIEEGWKKAKILPNMAQELKTVLRHRDRMVLKDDVLYSIKKVPVSKKKFKLVYRLVVPRQFRQDALVSVHDNFGHLGRDRCLAILNDRLWWPSASMHLERHIQNCVRCQKAKGKTPKAPLEHLKSTHPLHLVHMDYLTVKEGPSGLKKTTNILVVTDHYTRFSQAFVTQNQTAATVARVLWEKLFSVLGIPEQILTDQGTNFDSKLIHELCELAGTRKIRTSAYHPQTNGQCERFNSTLLSMIRTLDPKEKAKWPKHLAALCHAYNCSKNSATGFSPYELLFGRQPRLPVDVLFGLESRDSDDSERSYLQYVEDLKEKMKTAFELVQKKEQNGQLKQELSYNIKSQPSKLEMGDLVLLRSREDSKISDRWSSDVYIVVEKPYDDKPLYIIKGEDSIYCRSAHRNDLLLLRGQEEPEGPSVRELFQSPPEEDKDASPSCTNPSPDVLQPSGVVELDVPEYDSEFEAEAPQEEEVAESTKDVQMTEGPITRSRARDLGLKIDSGKKHRLWSRLAGILTGPPSLTDALWSYSG